MVGVLASAALQAKVRIRFGCTIDIVQILLNGTGAFTAQDSGITEIIHVHYLLYVWFKKFWDSRVLFIHFFGGSFFLLTSDEATYKL